MDVKEFAALGGRARAKKLGRAKVLEHIRKMVAARKAKRQERLHQTGNPNR